MRANIVNLVSKCCTPGKRDSLESVIALPREQACLFVAAISERTLGDAAYRSLTASGNPQHPVVSRLILRASKPVSISSSEFPRAVGEQQKLDRYRPK
jgi:hypothetical protein